MVNTASCRKTSNSQNATFPAFSGASVRSASALTVESAKMTTTSGATPTPSVQSAGNIATRPGIVVNASSNSVKVSTNTPVKNAKPFAMSDVTTWSIQRARQIRKTDFKRFVKLHNYFTAKDDALARPINSKASANRENVDHWVRSVLNPRTLACIQDTQETQQALLALIIVSAALTKYGEQELVRRNSFGEMDIVISARFGPKTHQTKPHSVGASYVLRLVLGLAPEKRAACQILREILNLDNSSSLVLVPTSKGLNLISAKKAPKADEWTKLSQCKIEHMAKQAQSTKFQEAMLQLGGQHLYDTIRTQLIQIGGVWGPSQDKPALQNKNPVENNRKTEKGAEHRKEQRVKNADCQARSADKYLPLEAAKWTQIPPPAPVSKKLATGVLPTNKELIENATATKATRFKNVIPLKMAQLMGAWAGPIPASIILGRPGAIVRSIPTTPSRLGTGGRVVLSRAF
ncbi:unnamed protein product [Phytophthora fragariaefolia]|uniref:Unnamed protein product n=1 Tax=Phytophthora fragariaefolia TaxID=1490495 RepID=A0A9W6X9Q7_9STRA|nr:unnamed protein product [Phytophthora fragariaefolia]